MHVNAHTPGQRGHCLHINPSGRELLIETRRRHMSEQKNGKAKEKATHSKPNDIGTMQAALHEAEQQLAQMQLDTVAKQAQLDTQHQEIDGLRKLAEAHTVAIAETATQAEERQRRLTATVTSLQVSLTGKMHDHGFVTFDCLATSLAQAGLAHADAYIT